LRRQRPEPMGESLLGFKFWLCHIFNGRTI
jgi:hypothetical protein